MKIILAITTLFVPALLAMSPADAVRAQQIGRPPMAPPPRNAPVVPVTTAEPLAPSLSETRRPGSAALSPVTSQPATSSRPIVPPTQTRPARGTQTSLLVEVQTTQTTGQIAVAIYRDPESFRRSQNPVRTLMLERKGAVTSAFVVGLPPGRYVIAAFQDTDGDGKLSKGNFGIPREPFGFSNNARARFGLPGFDAAAFELTTAGTTQRVVLRGLF
ncbi:MAG TPA: DUF2141 domain-containing protein [Brevundimonas sp.]|jgi:uncharacterized protein (DUF2141 family)